jgi:hypothetical protein
MVSWAGDGLIVGYDAITKKLKPGLFHFASPGSVDLGGSTRINYPMGAGLSATTYPNRLTASAPFTFTSADFTANPGKALSAALYLCDSANFPAGHVPTPGEILALGSTKVNVYRATTYVSSPQTKTFDIPGWNSGLSTNTKYWVLILPTALSNVNSPWNTVNDKPMANITVDTFGRALSLWANQTPRKPTISSPLDGTIALAGSSFTLKVNPNDPDETTPEDAQKFNDDVNGVQFQYAPLASTENPTPEWIDLPYDVSLPGVGPWRIGAWHIRGSRYVNGLAGLPELEALVASLGAPVIAGAGDSPSDYQPGKVALPTGDWQIRARTFDYGHPYPNLGTSTTQPGPLGINPATTQLIEPAKDSYPAGNTSPWSDPVRVTVPAQVPPPIPLYPTDSIAVPDNGEAIRLSWKYRNTHQPPRDQFRRAVQIRAVSGNNDWATIFDGYSTDTFVDLPPTLTQASVPPLSMLTDGGFELGGTNGWSTPNVGATLTNVFSPANAHSGNRYIELTGIAVETVLARNVVPPDEYENLSMGIWVWNDPAIEPSGLVQMYWLDADDNPIIPADPFDSPFTKIVSWGLLGPGWNRLVIDDSTVGVIHRPPGGVTMRTEVYCDGNSLIASPPFSFRFDDAAITAYGPDLDDFSFSATNEYEWRVQATDADGIVSNYSTAARFWVVPVSGTGEVRPVPVESIDGATLGCGTHRVFVYRRGGGKRVGEITNLSHVDWERKRDDISTAQVIVSGWDIDCGNLLAKLQSWAYELVIFRDNGYTTDRVWEGPITLLTYEQDKVTIDAKDVMGYAYRRIIKQKMSDAGTGNGTTVVDRARRVLQNTMAPDDPNVLAYMQVLARDDDAMQYRSTPAYSRTAFEEVDDMAANAGLDYTVVGRAILLWGTKHRIGTLPEFKDDDLGSSPIVSEYGMSMANRYVVSDGNGVWGEATRLGDDGIDENYGLVEMLSSTWASDSESETGTYTQEGLQTVIKSFEEFAERSIADRYPPPVVVRVPDNTTINPGASISIQHLVPGVVIPLRSSQTLRTVVASQKLDSVKVVEEKGSETVSITLSPFSRDDASTGEGGEE